MATTESNPASQFPAGYSMESSSGAIHDDPGKGNGDKKGAWKKPWSSAGPVMGGESWPALSPSGRNKSPSLELESMPQGGGAATPNDLTRKPFRRSYSTSSSTTNHPRSGSVAPRHPHRNGNRRYQSGFGRDMHLQPQRGFGILRPQMMLLGPPSFPQYGGPMLYPDYPHHVFMPPPDSIAAFLGPFPPPPLSFPTIDPSLFSKILTQVEFYFSADNLSRDKHLRRQMNAQGWVPVTVIAAFRRLAELTDDIQTILEALRSSQVVEIKGDALRRRGDWDKYLLPHEPSVSGSAAAGYNHASLGSQLESMTLSERSREGE